MRENSGVLIMCHFLSECWLPRCIQLVYGNTFFPHVYNMPIKKLSKINWYVVDKRRCFGKHRKRGHCIDFSVTLGTREKIRRYSLFRQRENTTKWTAQYGQAQEPAEKTRLRLWDWDKWLLEAHITNVPSSYFSISHHIALSTISKAWVLKHENPFYYKHAWRAADEYSHHGKSGLNIPGESLTLPLEGLSWVTSVPLRARGLGCPE